MVGPVDKAVVGGPVQRIGGFEYCYDTDTWTWSDSVAEMHGYAAGQVMPTTALVLSHKHPDDVERVKTRLQRASAPFASRHRIVTTTGAVRTVVVVGEALRRAGRVVGTRGFYVDVTNALNHDVQESISDSLDGILVDRAAIEQVKGMLMVAYDIDADAAFEILRWRSQELNVKISALARHLAKELPRRLTVDAGRRASVDHLLMRPF